MFAVDDLDRPGLARLRKHLAVDESWPAIVVLDLAKANSLHEDAYQLILDAAAAVSASGRELVIVRPEPRTCPWAFWRALAESTPALRVVDHFDCVLERPT